MNINFFKRILSDAEVREARRLIGAAHRIVITCHTLPDGDAIGSGLGMMHTLNALGHQARVVAPDPAPVQLQFMPGIETVVNHIRHPEAARRLIDEADLIICQDFNELKRTGSLEPVLTASVAPKLLIDHHLHPDSFADVIISHPEVSSTSMLVYRLLSRMGVSGSINRRAAECICTGMMTDTGNFSYNSNDADLYVAVADFVSRGVNKDRIYALAMNTHSENAVRLNAFALGTKMTVYPRHKAAVITLNRAELNRFQYQRGDTEGLVNRPLEIPEVTYSVYLRDEDGYVKVSCRSKGDFPVNKLCNKYFGGGGHLNAAGGEFSGSMEECLRRLDEAMADFDQFLK